MKLNDSMKQNKKRIKNKGREKEDKNYIFK